MLRTAFTGLAILVLVLAVATVGCKSGETGDGAEVMAAPAPPAPVAPQTDAPEADTVVAAAGGPLLELQEGAVRDRLPALEAELRTRLQAALAAA